jgi:MFS family permease
LQDVKGESVPTRQKGARRWIALAVLLAGGFLPPLDFFIVNVALSSIHESLGANAAALQLVVSGYASGYGVFLITGGRLGDLYGRKRCFLVGMAAFSLASLGCSIAPSPPCWSLPASCKGPPRPCCSRRSWDRSAPCSRMSGNSPAP